MDMLAVRWSEVLEQLNLVPVGFKDGDRDFSARHAGHFAGEITGMMRPMRKLEAENILPKRHRPFEVRDGDASVIGRNNVKRPGVHVNRLSHRRDHF